MKNLLIVFISGIFLLYSCVSFKPTYTKSISANGEVSLSNVCYKKKMNIPLAILTNIAIGAAGSQIKLEDDRTGLKKKAGLNGALTFGISSSLITYFIGRGYRSSSVPISDGDWSKWWAKVNQKEKYQTAFWEFTYKNYGTINSAKFLSLDDLDQFKILTAKDVSTYTGFFKNKIDINSVLARSYSQMDEGAITALVKAYPNNNYNKQLMERYSSLVAARNAAELRDAASAAAVVALFGGISKNFVEDIKESWNSPTSSTDYSSNQNTRNIADNKKDCKVETVPSFTEYYDGLKDNWIKKYDQYSIKFGDGKKGQIVYWRDDKRWSIYAPAGFSFRNDYQDYQSKQDAINALYEWEKCGTISKKGKQ